MVELGHVARWARRLFAVVVACVGVYGSTGQAVAQTYAPEVSLSADRQVGVRQSQVDTNSPSVTFTATVAAGVPMPSGYSLAIYDSTNAYVTSIGLSLDPRPNPTTDPYVYRGTTTYNVPSRTDRTYRAYLTTAVPTPGPPAASAVAGTSSTWQIQNVGWNGLVRLATQAATVDANAPSTTLTVHLRNATDTAAQPLAGAYQLAVYDNGGKRLGSWASTTQTSFTVHVTPGTNLTRSYTAVVMLDPPYRGGYSLTERHSDPVSVTNLGWTGAATTMNGSGAPGVPQTPQGTAVVNAQNPTSTLTLNLTKSVPAPYFVSIYDDTGTRLGSWNPTGTTVAANVAPPVGSTVEYTAYVSQDTPSTGLPRVDARPLATTRVRNDGWTGIITGFEATPAQTGANSPSSTLEVTTSSPVPSQYRVAVYDEQNRIVTNQAGNGTNRYTVAVTPGDRVTKRYQAYVTLETPTDRRPTTPAAASDELPVTDVGWSAGGWVRLQPVVDGVAVPLAVPPTGEVVAQTDVNSPSVGLRVTLQAALTDPYWLVVYDSVGTQVGVAYSSTAGWNAARTEFTFASVATGVGSTRTYQAYVVRRPSGYNSLPTTGALPADRVAESNPWVSWRLRVLEERMESCRERSRRGCGRRGGIPLRKSSRRSGWSASLRGSWERRTGRSRGWRRSWATASSQSVRGCVRPTSMTA